MARKAPKDVPNVPAGDVKGRLMGKGPRRAVVKGIPMGDAAQEQDIAQAMAHRFDGKGGRLRAATRRALGR